MPHIRPVLVGALIAAAGLASINGIAYAATGHGLVLGAKNTESRTTTLSDSGKNPALYLKTKPGRAPLKVNSRAQVAHLNASLVGGKTASALQTKAIHDELPVSTSAVPNATYTLPTMPAGSYQVTFDVDALMTVSGQVINCSVMEHGTMTNLLLAYGSSYETYSAVSGAGVRHIHGRSARLPVLRQRRRFPALHRRLGRSRFRQARLRRQPHSRPHPSPWAGTAAAPSAADLHAVMKPGGHVTAIASDA